MRAVFVLADVLRADPAAASTLRDLDAAGLRPLVLAPHGVSDGPRLDTAGYPLLTCPDGDTECWGDEPTLLLDASRRSGATPSEAFMVCATVDDVAKASEAGCRPVLVLGGRSLDEVYGPLEPGHKAAACADDMAMAARFMLDERAQHESLGTFPYGGVQHLDERARTMAPSQADVMRLIAVVVLAGITLALGIAYILQEVYQAFTFPAVFYYLTLQFIPQTWRGGLFLVVGAVVAVLAMMSLDRLALLRRRG